MAEGYKNLTKEVLKLEKQREKNRDVYKRQGMGSTPHAHAVAKVKNPCDQGVVAMMGVFIDTFVILTLTADVYKRQA